MTHCLMTDQPLSLLLALSPLFHQWVALKPSLACLWFSFEACAARMSYLTHARLHAHALARLPARMLACPLAFSWDSLVFHSVS